MSLRWRVGGQWSDDSSHQPTDADAYPQAGNWWRWQTRNSVHLRQLGVNRRRGSWRCHGKKAGHVQQMPLGQAAEKSAMQGGIFPGIRLKFSLRRC